MTSLMKFLAVNVWLFMYAINMHLHYFNPLNIYFIDIFIIKEVWKTRQKNIKEQSGENKQ